MLFDSDGSNPKSAFPVASENSLGGVRVQTGSGLSIDEEGNLSIDMATAEEIANLYEQANQQEN